MERFVQRRQQESWRLCIFATLRDIPSVVVHYVPLYSRNAPAYPVSSTYPSPATGFPCICASTFTAPSQ